MTRHGELRPDGRGTRWDAHRAARRREIVEGTLRAIREQGATVGMDEIAAGAGTSKTVLYRHFGDRAGLYVAVVESVHAYILSRVLDSLTAPDLPAGQLVRDIADAYLATVERDPDIYRFVVARPATDAHIDDPVTSLTGRLGDLLADALATRLRAAGRDADPAATWGHGITGFIWSVAENWLSEGLRRPRAELVEHVGTLFDIALADSTRVG